MGVKVGVGEWRLNRIGVGMMDGGLYDDGIRLYES